MEMQVAGEPVEPSLETGPGYLRLSGPEGAEMELVFTDGEGVLIRGSGCSLRLTAVPGDNSTAYALEPGCWVFNLRASLRRYRVELFSGAGELEQTSAATETNFESGRMVLTLDSGDGEGFECALDAFWSAWEPVERRSFGETVEAVRSEFAAFVAGMPPLDPSRAAAAREAAYILWSCTVRPCGQLRREAVFMSLNWMDQVWSWDNVFNLCALARGFPELAMDQMRVVADHQDEHGAYPDGLNDIFKHYNFSKPPVQGILLDWLRGIEPGFFNEARDRELYDTLSAFARFWMRHRLDAESGLPFYLHGNDSGQDNSTLFDKGGPLVTPDLVTYLIELAAYLSRTAEALGMAGEAREWDQVSGELLDGLMHHLWKGDCFVALKSDTRETLSTQSVLPFMPLLLGERLPPEARTELIAGITPFITEYGLATEHPESPDYLADGYWRGPSWGPSTMLMVIGLDRSGATEKARDLAQSFCRTCARSGFAENYDALTGAPLRDRAYTWTASAYLCLAHWLDRNGGQ
jgi:glycogen debranching enzyme